MPRAHDKRLTGTRMKSPGGWQVDAILLNDKPMLRVRDPYGHFRGYFTDVEPVQRLMGNQEFQGLEEA